MISLLRQDIPSIKRQGRGNGACLPVSLKFPAICLFTLFFIITYVSCANGSQDIDTIEVVFLKRIAVFPLENLTDSPSAAKTLTSLVKRGLKDRGVLILRDDLLENFLAENRIRYTGAITRITAKKIGSSFKVDAVMVGAVNLFYDNTRGRVKIGLTLRMISTMDGSIVWADTLSYSGDDFTGILGLGTISSMDTLMERLVRDMLKNIPEKITYTNVVEKNSFDIDRVTLSSNITRSGDDVEIRVRIFSVSEEPKQVKVALKGRESLLHRNGRNEYIGTITAPEVEGVFPVDMLVFDRNGDEYPFAAFGKVTVDNTPPRVNLSVSRDVFASKKKGFVIFTPKLDGFDYIDEWKIQILDTKGKVVRSDRGFGKLPKGLIWRGGTNNFRYVDDGNYTYRFIVTDIAGNVTTRTGKLRVKNTPPVVKIANLQENNGEIIFTFNYSSDEDIELWRLNILDKDGKALKKLEGKGGIPQKVNMDIDPKIDLETLSFSITVIDRAGNSFNLKKSISSVFYRQRRFSKSKGVDIEDF